MGRAAGAEGGARGQPRSPAARTVHFAGRGAACAPADVHHLSQPSELSGAIWTHRSFLIKLLHHSFSEAGATLGTGRQHAPDTPPTHPPPPLFNKEEGVGWGGGENGREGEITTVCACSRLAGRLEQPLGEMTYAQLPPPCTPPCFREGRKQVCLDSGSNRGDAPGGLRPSRPDLALQLLPGRQFSEMPLNNARHPVPGLMPSSFANRLRERRGGGGATATLEGDGP